MDCTTPNRYAALDESTESEDDVMERGNELEFPALRETFSIDTCDCCSKSAQFGNAPPRNSKQVRQALRRISPPPVEQPPPPPVMMSQRGEGASQAQLEITATSGTSALKGVLDFLNTRCDMEAAEDEYCFRSNSMYDVMGISLCEECDRGKAIHASDFISRGLMMYHAVGSQRDDARAEGAEDSERLKLDTHTDNARRENCLVKPDGNVNTPESSLTGTFEKSKQNKLIANCATVSHTKAKKRRGKKQTLKICSRKLNPLHRNPVRRQRKRTP